jgi:hypothetical protein
MGLNKIIKPFFNFNFFRGILSLREVYFFEIGIKFSIFDTLYDLFKEQKISPLRRAIFQILRHNNPKKIETPQNKEKYLF